MRRALVIAGLVAAGIAAGASWSMRAGRPSTAPPEATSNIQREDYVGPDACGECHPDKLAAWKGHGHARMNQVAAHAIRDSKVLAPFAGETLSYAGGTARFSREDGALIATLTDAQGVVRRYRVTRTIGIRYQQEYVGVLEAGPEASATTAEMRLPFGYWPRAGRWVHQQYYDSWFGPEWNGQEIAGDPYAPEPESWEPRCPWCHNTYAFDLRIERWQSLAIGGGIEALVSRPGLLAGSRGERARAGQLPLDELVTVGISCESCHLGGREHLAGGAMSFGPRHPEIEVRAAAAAWWDAGRNSKGLVDALCAQCHTAPSPLYAHGGARRNSSEARDLAASSCSSSIGCVDCHDPHVSSAVDDGLEARSIAACQGCHRGVSDDHGRHLAGSATCLDCHMPRVVQGFSSVIRTHRIGRAFDPRTVAAGDPNACNLCHLDRSIAWASEEVRLGWASVVAPPDTAGAAGLLWLSDADPHRMVTAAAAYARNPLGPEALRELVERLDQPVAYYRMRMLFAIEDILGRRIPPGVYDPTAPPATRSEQHARMR